MQILFLIRSLTFGGAERQLCILAKGLRELGHDVKVAVFYVGGSLEADFQDTGVPIISLDKKSRYNVISFLSNLVHVVKRERPDVVHSYLVVANIFTALLKPIFRDVNIVWGVRASNMALERYDWLIRLSYHLERKLSRFADLIISNSYAGLEYAVSHGFPREKTTVIANGIDTARFRPDMQARQRMRAEWSIGDDEILIGLVGRLDPMKDHPTFLIAAALLAKQRSDVRFVCVGDGPEPYKSELQALTRELGLDGRLIWAGAFGDMPEVYNALDIASSSSSFGEGFSNVIGEAMACGIPCVVTDVGDSKMIVGSTGVVVPPHSPNCLLKGWHAVLARVAERERLARQAREHIVTHYSVDTLISRTASTLRDLVAPH